MPPGGMEKAMAPSPSESEETTASVFVLRFAYAAPPATGACSS